MEEKKRELKYEFILLIWREKMKKSGKIRIIVRHNRQWQDIPIVRFSNLKIGKWHINTHKVRDIKQWREISK
jgi:hypothetical protein